MTVESLFVHHVNCLQDDNLPNSIRMDHLAYMIAFLVKICDLVGNFFANDQVMVLEDFPTSYSP